MEEKSILLEVLDSFSEGERKQLKKLATCSYWKLKPKDKSFLLRLLDASDTKRLEHYKTEKRRDKKNFDHRQVPLMNIIRDYIILLNHKKYDKKPAPIQREFSLINFYNARGMDINYNLSLIHI